MTDNNSKNKNCGVGLKVVFLIFTLVLLAVGVLCLLVVVKNLQDEQDDLILRVSNLEAKLEKTGDNIAASPARSFVPKAPPVPTSVQSDSGCCTTHKNKLNVLHTLVVQHSGKISDVNKKLAEQIQSSDVRMAEILQKLGGNSKEIRQVFDESAAIQSDVDSVAIVAESARKMATIALENLGVDVAEYNKHLKPTIPTPENNKNIVFGMAQAALMDYVISRDTPFYQTRTNDAREVYYEVPSYIFPVISFKKSTVENSEIKPETGMFEVKSAGNYAIDVSFCVRKNEETIVDLVKNDEVVRKMTVSPKIIASAMTSSDAEVTPPLPPGFDELGDSEKSPQSDNAIFPFSDQMLNTPVFEPPIPSDVDQIQEYPPMPSFDTSPLVAQHYFSQLVNLKPGDKLYLQIVSGKIVEYSGSSGDSPVSASCTRFTGFKMD